MLRFFLLLLLAWTVSCGGPAATATPSILMPVGSEAMAATPEPTSTLRPDTPLVRVDGAEFPVELAITLDQRSQGLSGRVGLDANTGMLFIYRTDAAHTFWMKDMRFPLDFVWIGGDCVVVDVTADAPPPYPGQSDDELPRYNPSGPVRYVLEINAGEAATADIKPGDLVEFLGSPLAPYGCRPG